MAQVRVMSFNIRGAFTRNDGVNAWPLRADLNVRMVARHHPDLIGLQEFQSGHLLTYESRLADYRYRMGPEVDNQPPHEYDAIFWNPERLMPLEMGGFWLSETPGRPSASWDTRCVRAANWIRFQVAGAERDLLHVNTHLDHMSEEARVQGALLILDRIAAIVSGDPSVVITGDFNCAPGSTAYTLFRDAGFADAHLAAGHADEPSAFTFHGFQGQEFQSGQTPVGRIDWVLVRGDGVRVTACEIVRDAEPPLYPSDHYPVLATIDVP